MGVEDQHLGEPEACKERPVQAEAEKLEKAQRDGRANERDAEILRRGTFILDSYQNRRSQNGACLQS